MHVVQRDWDVRLKVLLLVVGSGNGALAGERGGSKRLEVHGPVIVLAEVGTPCSEVLASQVLAGRENVVIESDSANGDRHVEVEGRWVRGEESTQPVGVRGREARALRIGRGVAQETMN